MSGTTAATESVTEDKPLDPKAIQVLREQLVLYRDKVGEIIDLMIQNANNQGKPVQALQLIRHFEKASETLIDIANKLIPYEESKLETISIKSQVEHKFVIRVPQQAKDVNEWMKAVGATRKITQPGFGNGDSTTDAQDIIVERDGPEQEEYLEPGEPPTVN